jgi:very-short-patch-repair endonuclease
MAKTSKYTTRGEKREKRRTKTAITAKNDVFTFYVRQKLGVECVREYRFYPSRMWRFDYAIPALRIAIEIDGGIWIQGRHNRASGYIGDMEKFNAAATLGWVVLKFTPQEQYSRKAFDLIAQTISNATQKISDTQ